MKAFLGLWQPFWITVLEYVTVIPLTRAFIFTSRSWTGTIPTAFTGAVIVSASMVVWTRRHGVWTAK